VEIADETPPARVRDEGEAAGVAILSINALQQFNLWNGAREAEAAALAAYARDCGARALVLCPLNARDDRRGEAERRTDLERALAALMPILLDHGLTGLVEPLGFGESSLRLKRAALDAIDAVGGGRAFAVLHDTFHHHLAGEAEVFPERTGLVHVSGVDDLGLARAEMRDGHRVLVGRGDRLGNLEQIRALIRGGYAGPLSFEPFARSVQDMSDIAPALRESMACIRAGAASEEASEPARAPVA
jgi:2-keto-myo-inositol isomerase